MPARGRAGSAPGAAPCPTREVMCVFYWLLKRIILGPFLHAIFRPWVRG